MKRYCYSCMNPMEGEGPCQHCGAPRNQDAPVHQLRPGTVLDGRYLVGKAIGQGGFGITYIGRDTVLDMRVAIKEYYPNGYATRNHRVSDTVTIMDDADGFFQNGKEKFLREAKILAKFCDDPGIVGVRDFFETNGTAYIVMEYLEGVTLKEYITERGPLPTAGVLELMHPIITVLGKVHAHGVIHRDISPDNILLSSEGVPKILDFGAARELGEGKSMSVMLKPGYAPEEQYRRKGSQGPWTDVYALCATMYFCLTGKAPEESIERFWTEDVNLVKPSEMGSDIRPRQEAVLLKGLAVKAADRYPSMAELEAALYPDPSSLTLTEFTLGERQTAPKPRRRRPEPETEEDEAPVAQKPARAAHTRQAEREKERPRKRQEREQPRPKQEKGSSPFLVLLMILAGLTALFCAVMLIRSAITADTGTDRRPGMPVSDPTGQNDLANVVFVPSAPQAATPTITDLRLQLNGQTIDASQGLSLRAGESCTLTALAYSNTPGTNASFNWVSSDSAILRLTPSQDTKSCECTLLQGGGSVTLTVSCYGQVLTVPVHTAG